MVLNLSEKANGQESRANNYVETVESSGYEESGAVDAVSNCKGGFIVFCSLEESKEKS